MTALTKEQSDSIKQSYLNILALLSSKDKVESRYLICLLKWAIELRLSPGDLRKADIDFAPLRFSSPSEKVERVEAIFHLVHMICLDNVVEDVELEIASIYAEKLGFRPTFVSELLKSIVTADSDEAPIGDVRQQVIDFIRLNEEKI